MANELPSTKNSITAWRLIASLTDRDANVRANAARVHGRVGNVRSVVPLCKLFHDCSPNVRRSAATALGMLGNAEALPRLVMLSGRLSVEERVAAFDALCSYHAYYIVRGETRLYANRTAYQYCVLMIRDPGSRIRTVANAMLDYLEPRNILLRPSPAESLPTHEILLRPVADVSGDFDSETLLHPDEAKEQVEEPVIGLGFWAKLLWLLNRNKGGK